MKNTNNRAGEVVIMEKNQSNMMTPVAIVVAGLIIGAAVIFTSGGIELPFMKSKSDNKVTGNGSTPQTTDTGYKYQQYVDLAGEIGLNEDDFQACMDTFDTTEVKADLSYASEVGASGTPTFFIGKPSGDNQIDAILLVGAQPYATFQAVLDAMDGGTVQDGLAALPEGLNVDRSGNPLEVQTISLDDDPAQGRDDAQVVMVEFSDYECPFCKRYFTDSYPQIKSTYIDSGKVKYVFRDLPLSFHDPVATEEAVAANCAREQNGDEAYFNYHDEIFNRTQSNGAGF